MFVDESARGQRYYIGAACVAQHDLKAVRQLARSLCVAGQRRWHFAKERDSRRATIIDALVGSELVNAWVGVGKGNEVTVRARCLQELGSDLRLLRAQRLVIESRAGRDGQDRRTLFRVLGDQPDMFYEHQPPSMEPCLWTADAVAWCYGAGGLWRERLGASLVVVRDVGRV